MLRFAAQRLRKDLFTPLSLRKKSLVEDDGIEPPTLCL
jgi:hypothetical protein